MNRTALTFIALLLPLIGICQQTERDSIRVFYLGGQSNMDGFGKNAECGYIDLGEKFAEASYLLNKK